MKAPVYVSLQYARGIAALAVVYFHAVLASVNAFAGRGAPLPWVGAFGVDLFFVLSGFVMWASTAGRVISPGEFYRRRLIRIVPFYWLMTTVLLALALLMPGAAETTVVKPAHAIASYFFVPWPNPGMAGRPISDVMTPLLVPGWTLNYEMFFYLLFGLVLILDGTWRFRALLFGLPLVMIACFLLSRYSLAVEFYGSFRLLEFAGGVVLCRVMSKNTGREVGAISGSCAVILGAIALPIIEAAQWPGHVLWLGLSSLTILWALLNLERQGHMPDSRLLKLLGDASFSIYLTHIFAIAGLRVFTLRLVPAAFLERTGLSQSVFVITALVVSVMIGLSAYVLLERPLTRFLTKKSRPAANTSDDIPVSLR
jgi:exopolysaccharide production protein ExoZ